MKVPEPSHVPHKDRWPSGNVNEYQLFQCPKCREWKRYKSSVGHRAVFCSVCGLLMQPRGVMHLEK